MFTAYHSSPLCSPSRAMLLTGVDNHRAGVATIEEILPPEQKGKPGYGLQFAPGVWTLARRLKADGYRTLMVGKWHLGHGPGALPSEQGFDRSLALDASGADNWGPRPYMPYYETAPWFENGKPAKMPASYYSSDMMVERLGGYIDEAPAGSRPFFAYLAFQAVHIPVQAPKAYSDHYRGRFDGGWAKIRAERAARARALGLLPPEAAIRGMPDSRPRMGGPDGGRARDLRPRHGGLFRHAGGHGRGHRPADRPAGSARRTGQHPVRGHLGQRPRAERSGACARHEPVDGAARVQMAPGGPG